MTTRAAVNIRGATGEIIDITSLGSRDITSSRLSAGRYQVLGTFGMVPSPDGWGYVVNQEDSTASIALSYAAGALIADAINKGAPSDLKHSITLHVLVADAEPIVWEPVPPDDPATLPDALTVAQLRYAELRAAADYAIAPLQDAVDIDMAEEADIAALKSWKQYRIALSHIPDQQSYPESIEWPTVPA